MCSYMYILVGDRRGRGGSAPPALNAAPATSISTIATSSVAPPNFNIGISTASVAPSSAATAAISSAPVALSTSTT